MSFISRAWSRLGSPRRLQLRPLLQPRTLPHLRTLFRPPLQPRTFANTNFIEIEPDEKVEEETLPGYDPSEFYPVHIGEVLNNRYQVVAKLGFGRSSTVWLARDLCEHCHVALKVFIHNEEMEERAGNEIAMYKRMEQRSSDHPGRGAIRVLLDSFQVRGPGPQQHWVLVHPPLVHSIRSIIRRTKPQTLPPAGLRHVLFHLFFALDYVHRECEIIHTDIKADNIMFAANDLAVFTEAEEEEMQSPSPRKVVEGRTIYVSRTIHYKNEPSPIFLCDFGSAVFGDREHRELVQPNDYRAPEVTLGATWDYQIDIWSIGCMIWDIFEEDRLLDGTDPEHQAYRMRAHLAAIVALLGPPPESLLERSELASKFFSDKGAFIAGIDLPSSKSLEEREKKFEGVEKGLFLEFMRKMLQWAPEHRENAIRLFLDPWLQQETSREPTCEEENGDEELNEKAESNP